MNPQLTSCVQQRGIILVWVLLLLLVLTLLTFTLFETATLQHKMVSNLANKELAFWQAETGIYEAEQMLTANPQPKTVKGNGWRYVCQQQSTCITDACYIVIATGSAAHAIAMIQTTYQLTTLHTPDGKTINQLVRSSWLEIGENG